LAALQLLQLSRSCSPSKKEYKDLAREKILLQDLSFLPCEGRDWLVSGILGWLKPQEPRVDLRSTRVLAVCSNPGLGKTAAVVGS
jgi:hypothetical protein